MVNWVCRSFESLHEPYTQHRGVYCALINGRLLHNRAYERVPETKVACSVEVPEQGLAKRKSMHELMEEPNLLEFLTAPESVPRCFANSNADEGSIPVIVGKALFSNRVGALNCAHPTPHLV